LYSTFFKLLAELMEALARLAWQLVVATIDVLSGVFSEEQDDAAASRPQRRCGTRVDEGQGTSAGRPDSRPVVYCVLLRQPDHVGGDRRRDLPRLPRRLVEEPHERPDAADGEPDELLTDLDEGG